MSETKTEQPPAEPIRLSVAAIIDGLYFRAGSAVPFETESDVPPNLKPYVITGKLPRLPCAPA